MGQDTTGTSLTTTAAASGRTPCFQFWVDWKDYGFVTDANLSTYWTEESAYVKEMSGDMQGVDWTRSLGAVGKGVVSSASVVLDNTAFRFSPSNASSPLRTSTGMYGGTNLIQNSSFETAGAGGADVFEDWTENFGSGDIVDEGVIVYAGSHSCSLTQGAATDCYIYQNVAVVPGIQYTVSLYTRTAVFNSAGRYKVYDNSNGANIIAFTSTGVAGVAWTNVQFTFTAPNFCTSVGLYFAPSATNTDVAYFDAVRLVDKDYIGKGRIHMKRAVIRTGFHSANLVLNPSFTTPGGGGADEFANWTENWSDGDIHWHDTVWRSAPASCYLENGPTVSTYIYQTFAVTAGVTYTLRFWTRAAVTTAGRYRVRDETGAADIIAITTTGVSVTDWTEVVVEFTTPAGCVSCGVYLYPAGTNGRAVYFDDVSVTAQEYLRQITGYIVKASENYQARTATLEIRDRGADLATARMSSGPTVAGAGWRMSEDAVPHDYLDDLVDQFDTDNVGKDSVGTADFETGMFIIPFAWMDDATVWAEFQDIAESQLGRLWYDKDGALHFDDGTHWVTAGGDAWDDPSVAQATLSMKFLDCSPQYEFSNVYNHIKVRYTAYDISAAATTVYTCREVLVVPPSTTITYWGEMEKPVQTYGTGNTLTATTDSETSPYWAISAGGTVMNASVTITPSYYTQRVSFSIANADTTYTAYIVKLTLEVTNPLLAQSSDNVVTVEDATSIAQHGRSTMTIDSRYIQTQVQAKIAADYLLSRFKDPVQIVTLTGVPARPWLEVGDRVDVTETAGSGIDGDYFIGRMQWAYGGGGYTQTLSLLSVADLFPLTASDYFIIGTSVYGSGAGHGHCFW